MKKLMMMGTVLMLRATVAHAGIDMSWDGCTGSSGLPASGAKTLVCDGTGLYEIYGQVQPSAAVPNGLAYDGQIDWQNEAGPFACFWEWESGGTNDGTLVFLDTRGSANPNCQASAIMQGNLGSQTTEVFAFTRGNTGPNRAQLMFAMARTTALATTIAAGTNLYVFTLLIDESVAAGTGGLDGCTDPVAAVLSQVNITSATQLALQETAPGLRDKCIFINGGGNPCLCYACDGPGFAERSPFSDGGEAAASQSACGPTPARNQTWGSVKTLYR